MKTSRQCGTFSLRNQLSHTFPDIGHLDYAALIRVVAMPGTMALARLQQHHFVLTEKHIGSQCCCIKLTSHKSGEVRTRNLTRVSR